MWRTVHSKTGITWIIKYQRSVFTNNHGRNVQYFSETTAILKNVVILIFSGGKHAVFIQLCFDKICSKFGASIAKWKNLSFTDLICWATLKYSLNVCVVLYVTLEYFFQKRRCLCFYYQWCVRFRYIISLFQITFHTAQGILFDAD